MSSFAGDRSDADVERGAETDAGANDRVNPSGEAPVEETDTVEDRAQASGPDEGLRSELSALTDRHLRLAAEFDNYRKRTERERTEAWARSQAELAGALLDVVDDLQRVAHVDPATASAESMVEGIQLVERKLQRALTSAGLEEVDAQDQPFDPLTMEALMTVPAESEDEDDRVAAVLQKGYRFKGQLLRPARVQVRKHG